MNIDTAVIFLGAIAALGATVWGLFAKRRSAAIGIIAAAVALLAAVCAWYAWAETKSIPWTLGYGAVVGASLASSVRQLWPSSKSRRVETANLLRARK
jgi:di/tricarboxylate transporter